jgi:RNA polymerase sigma-70 factor (ECF subfamily)
MTVDTPLASALLEPLSPASAAQAGDPGALEQALAALVEGARAAWPALAEPPATDADFVRHLAARLTPDAAPLAALGHLHAADLYLAWACRRGRPAAIAEFERRFMPEVAGFVARVATDPSFVDELRQQLRQKLFLGASPKIESYSGGGPLGGWLRVVAVRSALNLRRDQGETREVDDLLPATGDDPEMEFLKREHRAEVQAALDEALGELPPEDRAALKLHHVDGLTLDQLTVVYRESRSAMGRRMIAIRRAVLLATRRRLVDRLGLRSDELESLIRVVRSQLRITIGSALK